MTSVLAGIGIGGSILGAGLGAESASVSGQANSQMYQYQAAIAQQNAKIAKQNASYAMMSGEQQAMQVGLQGRAQIGATKVAQGASNLDINSGSAAAVVSSEHQIGGQEQYAVRSTAAQTAYGYEIQSAQDTTQSQVDTQASMYAQEGASIGEASSIIGGAASVSSKWLSASQSGAFSGGGGYGYNPTYGGGSWGLGF